MLKGKQRAYLRGLANTMDAIIQVGKGGVTPTLLQEVDDALRARELIKLRVLETAPEDVRSIADTLAERSRADVVQTIGSRFVLYRRNPKKPRIVLPA